jgi:hypothetical protein
MEKEFIPYEQALELKELGFDEEQYLGWYESFYSSGTPHLQTEWLEEYLDFDILVPAPLYQQAFRWFRQKYGLIGWVEGKKVYKYCIKNSIPNDGQINFSPFKTNEEAELACIKKLIEIVIQHEL